MKRILLIAAFLTANLFIFAQGSESFDNHGASGSTYSEGSYIGDNGNTWTYDGARNPSASYQITGKSIGFGRSTNGIRFVSSNSGTGGVGDVTFSILSYFTGGDADDRTMEVLVDGVSRGSFTMVNEGVVETHTISGINAPGDVSIRFQSTGPRQIVLDDVSWTALPTPVQMTYFSARTEGKSVNLAWETASEINNAYFEVERSKDGKTFESIAKIDGNGTTSATTAYTYLDTRSFNGMNYYRLKQVDLDGAFSHSEVRSVGLGSSNEIKLFASMVVSSIEIQSSEELREDASITIFDMVGNFVLSTTFDRNSKSIDVSGLPQGQYIIHINSGNHVMVERFAKIAQ